MLTFIPWVLLVLQKIESSGLDGGGTLPGLCHKSCKTVFNLKNTIINIRAVTNPKKISDPNPNEVSCRISDPDPIIHKIYIKHNKTC